MRLVRCTVSGSNPLADVMIYLDKDDITKSKNFTKTVTTTRGKGSVDGLGAITNTITVEKEIMIDYSYARKAFKCVGKVPTSETELSRSIKVKFQGCKYHSIYNKSDKYDNNRNVYLIL